MKMLSKASARSAIRSGAPNWLQVEKSHDEVLEKVTILGLVRTTTHYAMTGILFYTVINFGYAYAPPVIGCWYIAKLLMDKYFPV